METKNPLTTFVFLMLFIVAVLGLNCMLTGCETTPIKHDNTVILVRPDFPRGK